MDRFPYDPVCRPISSEGSESAPTPTGVRRREPASRSKIAKQPRMKNKLFTFLVLHLGLAAVVAQPVITNLPQNQTAIAGATVTFSVGATGTPPLSYQWRSHASVNSYTNIPFGTEATLVLTDVQPTSRRFAVVVTDAGGLSVTSSPLVTLTVVVPPSITVPPMSQTVDVGSTANFTVTVTGSAPFRYQWRFNDAVLAGKTNFSLTLANVQYTNAGRYSVTVTNLAGSITSQAAILTVAPMLHGFSGIAAVPSGSISLTLAGAARAQFRPYYDLYPLEVSTNLRDWSPLVTLVRTNASNDMLSYVDAETTNYSKRFYRTPTNHLVAIAPKPAGPYAVGTSSRLVTDPSRTNRYGIPTNSSFMVQFWYPAEAPAGVLPAPYIDRRIAGTWATAAAGFGADVNSALYQSAVSRALPDVPVSSGQEAFPVVIFSHGYQAVRTMETDVMETLASQGFIAVAMDHSDAWASVFPDGRIVRGNAPDLPIPLALTAEFLQGRTRDIRFVLDELARLNQQDTLLRGRLDLGQIGIFGHSFGGAVTADACAADNRIRAGFSLDGGGHTNLLSLEVHQPFFISIGDDSNPIMIPNRVAFRALFDRLTQPAYWLPLRNAAHLDFVESPWFVTSPDPVQTRTATIMRRYVLSFFINYLKGMDDHLLDGPPGEYPEIQGFLKK